MRPFPVGATRLGVEGVALASSEIVPLVISVAIRAAVRPLSARQTIIGSSYLKAIVAFEGWGLWVGEGEAPNVMVQIVQVPIGGFKSILASCYVSLSSRR